MPGKEPCQGCVGTARKSRDTPSPCRQGQKLLHIQAEPHGGAARPRAALLEPLQVVPREDHAGAGGAAAVPPRDGAVPGAGEHQLPRGLHPVRQLRGQGGALPHHLLLQQAQHRRGGLLREPHAAGGGEAPAGSSLQPLRGTFGDIRGHRSLWGCRAGAWEVAGALPSLLTPWGCWGQGPGGGTRTLCRHPWPRAATWWDLRARHRLGGTPTPGMSPAPRQGCHSHPTVSPQHYTTDADGLCTRLIKPKLMEGTVAAQDEFSRSEWPCPPPRAPWGPPSTPSLPPSPPCRRLGPQHEGPQVATDHWQRGIRR